MVSLGSFRTLTLQAGDKVVQFTRDDVTIPPGGATGWFLTLTVTSYPVSGDLSGTLLMEENSISLDLPLAATQRLEPPEGQEPLAEVDAFGLSVIKFKFDDGSGNTFSGVMALDWDVDYMGAGQEGMVRGYLVSTKETGAFSGQKLIGILAMKYRMPDFEILRATITLRRYFADQITPLGTTGFEGTTTTSPQRSIPTSAGDTLLQFTRDNVAVPGDDNTAFWSEGVSASIISGPLTGTMGSEVNVVGYHDGLDVDWVAGKFSIVDGDDAISGVVLIDMAPGEGYMFALSGDTTTGKYAGNEYFATLSASAEEGVFTGSAEFVELSPAITDTTSPAAITDLATSNPTCDSITLTWTAPGDDADTGTASQYDIRYSTSTITDANWDAATQCAGEPSPQAAGSSESFTVTELSRGTTYYFAIKTADEVSNWSGLSNVASGTTLVADANGDGKVDLLDLVAVAVAFNTTSGDPSYNPNADLNSDDTIDIFDLVLVGIHFAGIG
ncbi:MAG TPA: hypothetical protein G4O03_00120 [Dehalococcoidia bacterium]|nr:hypothetical protein [Dehalococcoidia bacterium]